MARNPVGMTSLCIDLETRARLAAIGEASGIKSLAGVVRALAAVARPSMGGDRVEITSRVLREEHAALTPRKLRLERLGLAGKAVAQ